MNGTNTDHGLRVVKLTQELLFDEEDRSAINSDLISEKIDMVLRMCPKWGEGLDREFVVKELLRRFGHWTNRDNVRTSEACHK